MHELAITESLVAAVSDTVAGARVTRVRLAIGKLSGVAPDSVRFCFDVCAEGTVLEGAHLEIEEPPGMAWCRSCHAEMALDDLIGSCRCGSTDLELRGGQELRIREVELA